MADGLTGDLAGVPTADRIRTVIAVAGGGQRTAVDEQVGRIGERVGRRPFDSKPSGAGPTLDGEAVLTQSRAVARLGRDLRSQLAASGPGASLRIGFGEDVVRTAARRARPA